MLKTYRNIGENKFREENGLTYNDLAEGSQWEHRPGRTITDVDNMWGSMITMNQHPAHCDAEYAKQTEFGRILVNSAITFAIVNGMTVGSMSARCVANLGWDEVRLVSPVFVGDTLYAESTVTGKRQSQSRTGHGIVTIFTIGRNQTKAIVMTMKRSFLMKM
ncbi:MaoC family dehydratase [Burkholderia glumae]|uniref:MaoC family dehydratase n=1 Tax=Burkholderia glumae TaxID=337 RepID=UPI0003A0D8CA|nr:MaoC family dehydratase [Burkholderia glumae]